ncbi:MAG: amylo-alpha-1,6-glucosidase [Oligoflexia bacterium]|nr:amylo-alpha-1,6-glucosidase [Oligoflexia bacterium]
MGFRLDCSALKDKEQLHNLEWLETNALGGYASAPVSGAHTRKYHGILVAALNPPTDRAVLISKLDETLIRRKERIELSSNFYRDSTHPQGFKFLCDFSCNPAPSFLFEALGIRLRKTILCLHHEQTTLIRYQVEIAPPGSQIEFRPLFSGRGFHSLQRAYTPYQSNPSIDNEKFKVQLCDGQPHVLVHIPGASFKLHTDWYYNFRYPEEERRGYPSEEDLLCYGYWERPISSGDDFIITLSCEKEPSTNALASYNAELQRRDLIRTRAGDNISADLALAGDKFIVKRGNDLCSIIAGYHWFNDWSRDAMISLPGLCLVTGRYDEARRILLAYANRLNNGILPNNFPDLGSQPQYNTIDATLWFVVAVFRYLQYSGDRDFVADLLPILSEISEAHLRGTHHGIHVDDDGLLMGGNPTIQLTWMDAKIGDWVVTARQGKAVEINALWYNLLSIMSILCTQFERATEAEHFAARARVAYARFNEIFWNGESDSLFDFIDGRQRDGKIRPNQVFALSLPFPLLDAERGRRVLRTLEDKLLTPLGLRTLSPEHPSYQRVYIGSQPQRDAAYHQGTVWPFLLGPYASALCRFGGAGGKARARSLLEELHRTFFLQAPGLIPEICDGEPPHTQRGAIAQAWSIAEIARAWHEDILGKGPCQS